MTLLAPNALWWLLSGALIVAIFLMRRRIVVVEIPALEFWEQMLRYNTLGRWGRRLRRWISLALHLLIVALLAGALTEPINPAYRNELLVVLDDSATMQTIEDDGRSRFEHAADLLLERRRLAPSGIRTTIILAAAPPKILTDSETVDRDIRAALHARRPRDCPPEFDQALALACRGRRDDAATILVISDRDAASLFGAADVEYLRVGLDQPNVGIAAVTPARDEAALEVLLHHRQMSPRTATISIMAFGQTALNQSPGHRRADNHAVARTTLVLRESPALVKLPVAFLPGDEFLIRVEPADAFMLDNTAYAVWPALTRTRVRLVTADNIFMEAALDQPDAALEITAPNNWTSSASADVTIFDAPAVEPGKPVPGRYIIFGGVDPFGLCRVGETTSDIGPSQWAADHVLIRDVDLLQWRIAATNGRRPPRLARRVVEGGETPLIFTIEIPGKIGDPSDDFKAVYINFDLSNSNVARRAGFPVFVWNALDYLLDKRPEDEQVAQSAGGPLTFPAQSRTAAIVADPAGQERKAYVDGARHVLPFTEQIGFYRLEAGDSRITRAVNYYSDASSVDAATNTSAAARTVDPAWTPGLPVWGLLAAAAGLLLIIEALLFHRGVLKIG